MVELGMVDDCANLRLIGGDALAAHTAEPATDHLRTVDLTAELARAGRMTGHLGHVPALAQHGHADYSVVLAAAPDGGGILARLFVLVFGHDQRAQPKGRRSSTALERCASPCRRRRRREPARIDRRAFRFASSRRLRAILDLLTHRLGIGHPLRRAQARTINLLPADLLDSESLLRPGVGIRIGRAPPSRCSAGTPPARQSPHRERASGTGILARSCELTTGAAVGADRGSLTYRAGSGTDILLVRSERQCSVVLGAGRVARLIVEDAK